MAGVRRPAHRVARHDDDDRERHATGSGPETGTEPGCSRRLHSTPRSAAASRNTGHAGGGPSRPGRYWGAILPSTVSHGNCGPFASTLANDSGTLSRTIAITHACVKATIAIAYRTRAGMRSSTTTTPS